MPQTKKEAHEFVKVFFEPGLGLEESIKAYDATAENYNASVETLNYIGPAYTADMITSVLRGVENPKILDVAAGTGMVGEELHRRGYRNVDAHDGAQAMLDVCKDKGWYCNFTQCILGGDEKIPVPDNTYDGITISGAVIENHLPPDCMWELVRILKPGGYFVNTYRTNVLPTPTGRSWVQETERLEKAGKWKQYGKLRFPRYYLDMEGVVEIFQKV